MGSINAQLVAMKVSEKARKGEKISVSQIMRDVGYSKHTAKNVKAMHTKSYKTAMELERQPILEGLQRELNEIKQAMANKDKSGEDYRVLVASFDLLTKNYQLLSGGATERQVFVLPSEVMGRNAIVSSDPKQLPDNGSTEPQKG